MTHRIATVLACLVTLTLGACASVGPSGSELLAERSGDAELITFDESEAAPWRERALGVVGTASVQDLLEAQGCVLMGPADVAAASPEGEHLVFVEQSFDCGMTAPRVVTVFGSESGVAADAEWLSTERLDIEGLGGAVARLAVMRDGIVAERTPTYGQQTREVGRVTGHGEAIADTCDQALIASAWLAMEDAIERCGPDTYVRLLDGEATHSAQLLPTSCRATTDQPYACHEATVGEPPFEAP
ncbi:MAG: hypothetical protein H6719_24795 [Sandaracinaceae bacterium]|nr:hypothetical protein [Sandaracinaceae bacterium]